MNNSVKQATFQAKAGSNEFFVAWVPSANVKAGANLEYVRKDGQVLTGTARAILGGREVGGIMGTDLVFAKTPKAAAVTKAQLEARVAEMAAQLEALMAAAK